MNEQDEVREDGTIVGGEGWQETVHNREEWRKAHENDKESSHSAHANGMNEWMNEAESKEKNLKKAR